MAQNADQNVNGLSDAIHLPSIAAAFLVTFDNRKGYTIAWQRALDDIKLDGAVEFKSLPSGLHNVEQDLVYFVHDDCVGISAFLRKQGEEEARNARMLAVGVLVPIDAGRMGKAFLYAQSLRNLAYSLIEHPNEHSPLEDLWNEHKTTGSKEQDSEENNSNLAGYQKLRTLSATSLNLPATANRSLPAHHPALALPEMLHVFGPLIFPLFRAALLRKRILILGEAPVEFSCDFVYNISVLSSVSQSMEAHVPPYTTSTSRLRPLFNIGVSDIALLEELKNPWVACTTDDILAMKPDLFDLLVILPSSNSSQKFSNKTYPMLIHSAPELLKSFPRQGILATRRDASRYAGLKHGIQSLQTGGLSLQTLIARSNSDTESISSSISSVVDEREAVEPMPWSLMAYTSLVWWASAGDRRSGLMEAEELASEQDEALLRDSLTDENATKEFAMVAYFHKLSALIFSTVASAAKRASNEHQDRYNDEVENGGQGDEDQALLTANGDIDDNDIVEISEEDVRNMGLDIWSESDKQFISDMVRIWWKRKAVVRSGIIECCGIRIM